MPKPAEEFDFFWEEPGATAYVQAVLDSADKGLGFSIHPHTALDLAVEHQVSSDRSKIMCLQAVVRAKEMERQARYFPHKALPIDWIDNMEGGLDG